MPEDKKDDDFVVLWGATDIGEEIGKGRRATFYLLETGQLPAEKVGGRWASTRRRAARTRG